MENRWIPLHKPAVGGNELQYLAEVVRSGRLSGDGAFARRCEAWLQQITGVARAFLTPSGTHALEIAALLLNLQPADEVIIPTFTFPSTANAFLLRGARPVLVDIRPDTLNLDERQLPLRISSRTRVIVPVHYAGIGCEMEAILTLARRYGLAVVEDNAHGLFGRYRGKPLGSFGSLAAVSFHETKNVTCGEGGALLINDPQYIERAEIIREKGTDRARFLRGEVKHYMWRGIGSSYLPSELQAAFLCAQLEASETLQQKRRRLWLSYIERLRPWAEEHRVQLPVVPPPCEPAYHLFYLILPSERARDRLRQSLQKRGIASAPHYVPLHLSEMGQRLGYRAGDCPVAERVFRRLLRLPFHPDMTESDLERIISAIHEATSEVF